ncbi:MAG: protein kinase [Sandaracinaceae bacterium]|nr:protein kinase [Sandaracinaceae bacterium]
MTDLSLPPGIAIRMTAESLLHRGRMGLAYRARSGAGAEGVLRVLDPELSRAATDRMRLSRGLEKLMTVSHPSLVVPIEHGEDGGQLWYLRPYVSGVTLAERLAQGPLPLPEALSIGGQVADALHALHRAGLLHRDLCSERVVLQPDGRAVLIDATVAAPLGPEYDKVFGTAPFVSPEEVEGKPTSFRSDLYALGIMLYAAIAGEPPFEGNIPDVLEAHLQTAPPALEAGLSADVRALLDQLLDKEPRRRPFSAQKVARTLQDYVPEPLRPSDARPSAPGARAPVVAAPRPAPAPAPPRPAAPPLKAKATMLGMSGPVPPPAAPAVVAGGAPPAAPVAPAAPTEARQPSIPPPVPPGAPARSAKRTMMGMPALSAPITAPPGKFRDDATQQVQLDQIVEAREVRTRASAPPPLGTSTSASRADATQQVGLEQIVEVRESRLPPPVPSGFERTVSGMPAPPPIAPGFEEDEPTTMFDGAQLEAAHAAPPSAAVPAPAAPAPAPAPVATGFEDDEPTRMFEGHAEDEPPTVEMALPPARDGAGSFDEDEPTSMFASSDLDAASPAEPSGLAAPIIAPSLTSAEPATAPLGAMPLTPPPRVSAPPPVSTGAAQVAAPPPSSAALSATPPTGAAAPAVLAPPAALLAQPPGVPPAATDGVGAPPAGPLPSPGAAGPVPAVAPQPAHGGMSAAPSAEPQLAHPIPEERPTRRWVVPAGILGLLVLLSACGFGIWFFTQDGDGPTAAAPPAATTTDGTVLTAPAVVPDAGVLALGPPDLGPPDLGPPDLGPPDTGVMDDEAFMNGPRPRGRAERARWLALRRAAAASMRPSGGGNASAASRVQEQARAATSAGNHAEATRLYEQLTRMTPSSAGAWYSLGTSRMRQRNGRGAAAALERATQLSPRNANYWATLGTARRNAGDSGGSRAAFQQALRLDPNNAAARRGLGQ